MKTEHCVEWLVEPCLAQFNVAMKGGKGAGADTQIGKGVEEWVGSTRPNIQRTHFLRTVFVLFQNTVVANTKRQPVSETIWPSPLRQCEKLLVAKQIKITSIKDFWYCAYPLLSENR